MHKSGRGFNTVRLRLWRRSTGTVLATSVVLTEPYWKRFRRTDDKVIPKNNRRSNATSLQGFWVILILTILFPTLQKR